MQRVPTRAVSRLNREPLIFTSLAAGNVRLSTALLPWHLVLQLLLLPLYLIVLAGVLIRVEYGLVLQGVLLVLLIPLGLSWIFRGWAERVKREQWLTEVVLPKTGTAQVVFLNLAIAAMFASQGAALVENPFVVVRLLVPLLAFFLLTAGLAI